MGRRRLWTGKSLLRAERVLEVLGIDGRPFTARDFIGVWMDMPNARDCPMAEEAAGFLRKHEAVIRLRHGNQVGVKGSGKANLYGVDEMWLEDRGIEY